jgi:hypothetical protein
MIITTFLVALFWIFSFKTGFARTLLFARFARTLPGSQQSSTFMSLTHGHKTCYLTQHLNGL